MHFEEVLERTGASRTALLGNGFSRAWNNDCFAYERLFEDCGLSKRPASVFDVFKTRDFEAVMRALWQTSSLLKNYDNTSGTIAELKTDLSDVRTALITAIKTRHPARPGEVTDDEYATCKLFLDNFEDIFTTNYDLLLYWALNRALQKDPDYCNDGFRKWDGVLYWKMENAVYQNIFFLHGAFHIIDAQPDPNKLAWVSTPIIEQLDKMMEKGHYPLFVSEGLAEQKLTAIYGNHYLSFCLQKLLENELPIVTYGLSCSAQDEHILRAIERGFTPSLYVGIHPTMSATDVGRVIGRLKTMEQERNRARLKFEELPPLTADVYESETAKVWR